MFRFIELLNNTDINIVRLLGLYYFKTFQNKNDILDS